MKKTEVYSWRVSPLLKASLEEAAHDERKTVAQLLEEIARGWLSRREGAEAAGSGEEQERLRSRAMKYVGALAGGDPRRSASARQTLRARLGTRRKRTAA